MTERPLLLVSTLYLAIAGSVAYGAYHREHTPVLAEKYVELEQEAARSCAGPALLKKRLSESPALILSEYNDLRDELARLGEEADSAAARARILATSVPACSTPTSV